MRHFVRQLTEAKIKESDEISDHRLNSIDDLNSAIEHLESARDLLDKNRKVIMSNGRSSSIGDYFSTISAKITYVIVNVDQVRNKLLNEE